MSVLCGNCGTGYDAPGGGRQKGRAAASETAPEALCGVWSLC